MGAYDPVKTCCLSVHVWYVSKELYGVTSRKTVGLIVRGDVQSVFAYDSDSYLLVKETCSCKFNHLN